MQAGAGKVLHAPDQAMTQLSGGPTPSRVMPLSPCTQPIAVSDQAARIVFEEGPPGCVGGPEFSRCTWKLRRAAKEG